MLQHVLEREGLHHVQGQIPRASNQEFGHHHHHCARAKLSMHAQFGLISLGAGIKVWSMRHGVVILTRQDGPDEPLKHDLATTFAMLLPGRREYQLQAEYQKKRRSHFHHIC
jgi:hypothetical protein